MPHATLLKFGYPDTLIHEGKHWALLARPAQVTLGSLVLCSTSEATAYSDLSVDAFLEQAEMVRCAERLLKQAVDFERINYLMLMMVDPHVHFHVIPRYEGNREFDGIRFPDSGWPGPPNLGATTPLPPGLVSQLRSVVAERN